MKGHGMRDELQNAVGVTKDEEVAASPSFILRPSSLLTIALAKGRMQDEALRLLACAGVRVSAEALASRRLAIEDERGRYRFVFVKPADVPVYVEHGIADCGVVGRDVLLEAEADVLQPLDLGISRCRIAVAARAEDATREAGMLRVATKYPRIAAAHFGARGVPVEIIELSGSVELAPVLGLADCIVDLVETGRTLAENGLVIVEEITTSTGRLVVNRASYQLKAAPVAELIDALRRAMHDSLSG
jgi:ATP phosphoribosyltransferase